MRTIIALLLACFTASGAQLTINVGTNANDGRGDSIRAAFQKANTNFTELYAASNLTLRGFVTLTNLNGVTVASTAITNTGGIVTNLFTIPMTQNSQGMMVKLSASFFDVDTPVAGGFESVATFYSDGGLASFVGGVTNLYNNTGSGADKRILHFRD